LELLRKQEAMTDYTRRNFVKSLAATAAILPTANRVFAQETAPTVALALVGGAHIHAPGYLEHIKTIPGLRLKSVWDPNENRAAQRAEICGAKVVKKLDEIWDDRDIAGVIICSETFRHRELVSAAAAAKKPMFVEKPLGMASAEARAMADAIEKSGAWFTTGYYQRAIAAHMFLKEQIAKGSFGRITRARCSNCHDGALAGIFDGEFRWMADPKQSGGGGFGDLGTHVLDLLMWFFGDLESVTAEIKSVTGKYGPDCDETGEAMLRFKNGVTANFVAGWTDVANPVTLEINGTEGHAIIYRGQLFFKGSKVAGADGMKSWKKMPESLPSPLDQFLDAVTGKPGPGAITPREAATRVAAMETLYRAAREHAWLAPA
jgi:predicted dehydrogenase